MTIANELSSEVAAALLEAHEQEETSANPNNIRDVIVAVHSTLRNLKVESRRGVNQSSQLSSKLQPGSSVASGNH